MTEEEVPQSPEPERPSDPEPEPWPDPTMPETSGLPRDPSPSIQDTEER